MVSVCQSDSPLHQNLTKHKYRRDLEIRVKLWFLLQQHRSGCHCWPGSVTQTNLFLPGLIIYSVLCEKQGFVMYIITDFFMSVSKNKWRRSFEGLGLKVFCQVSSASLPINSGVNIKTCWRIMMSSSLKICESRRHVRPSLQNLVVSQVPRNWCCQRLSTVTWVIAQPFVSNMSAEQSGGDRGTR